jgi:hypothetical protein
MTESKAKRGFFVAVPIALLALVLVGLLLVPQPAQADLFATNVVYAWDIVAEKYQNSNVIVSFSGSWVPFIHEMRFDNDPWTYDPLDVPEDILPFITVPATCPATVPTVTHEYAGLMYYGLGHLDTDQVARGFQETRDWELIDCDRDGSGAFNNGDLSFAPPQTRSTYINCAPGNPNCDLLDQDRIIRCSNNTCWDEIVTTFFINLDADCDGTLEVTTDELCFYSEARTPDLVEGETVWGGNLQARISTVGGDKTVNFSVLGWPTAIEMDSFGAEPQGDGVRVTWQTATELDLVGFNLYRSSSRGGPRTQVNAKLIASQMPGSAVGAAYSFVDGTVAKGGRYYYWLEELDVHGGTGQNGPAIARGLPRLRPSPMPVSAIQ